MQKSVSLKGTKSGYKLIVEQSASFHSVCSEVEELVSQLKRETKPNQTIELTIETGTRLLSDDQQATLRSLIEEHSSITVKQIQADVVELEEMLEWHKRNSTSLKVQVVRSGQMIDVEGDLLLVGGVHPGGTVRATGNIFIIGELKGIAHAGFSGNENAIVVANFRHNAQVRLADHVHIVDVDEEKNTTEFEIVYLNDLHIIAVSGLEELKQIRPELGKQTGGFS